jgi:tricorn protease interacting factor F2/3
MVDAEVNGFKVTLKQKRFLLEGASEGKQKWMIPISVRTPDTFSSKLMTDGTMEFTLENVNDWFKLNYGQKGFYRVKYGHAAVENLKSLIRDKKLENVDRWGIQNDMFALLLSGEETLKHYFDFIESYSEEDDYIVSVDIADSLYYSYLLCSNESFVEEIAKHGRKHFKKMLNRLGWDTKPGEKHTDALLRGFAINVLGKLGDKEVIDEANRRFNLFLENPDSLNPDIRLAVYSLVAWSGDSMTYQKLYEQFRKAPTQEEKLRFQAALSSFQDERLLKDSLEFSLSNEVKLQDLYINIIKVSVNPKGRHLVWPWIKANWKDISARFDNQGNPLLNRIIATLSVVADASMEKEIQQFFKRNKTPGTEMRLSQTLEKLRINSKFLERVRKEFGAK